MPLSAALSSINLLAVLVAGVVHMATGLVWYQTGVFGAAWAALTGKDLKPAKQWLVAGIIGHLAVALVRAVLINLAGVSTAIGGLAIAVWR